MNGSFLRYTIQGGRIIDEIALTSGIVGATLLLRVIGDLYIIKCSDFQCLVRAFEDGKRYGVVQAMRDYCRPEVSA
jgi:hypothetical protein